MGVRRELHDQFIAVRNGKSPWSTKAFVCTVCEIERYDVGSSGICADKFCHMHPQEWNKPAWITSEKATKAYMVEVIAAFHCLKKHRISCRYSTCLLQWQGKEAMYSWNSPTCAWHWIWPKGPHGGFSHTVIEEAKYLIKKPCTEVREERKWGVELPGHAKVKAVIERHPAILCQNHMARCLPCPNGTAKNPQTRWRHKGTGVPPPIRYRQPTQEPTPEPTPGLPRIPPATTGNISGAQSSQIINLPARYEHLYTSLPCAESFSRNASAQDCQNDIDFDSDMLTEEETATG